jgi:hypothetical protein
VPGAGRAGQSSRKREWNRPGCPQAGGGGVVRSSAGSVVRLSSERAPPRANRRAAHVSGFAKQLETSSAAAATHVATPAAGGSRARRSPTGRGTCERDECAPCRASPSSGCAKAVDDAERTTSPSMCPAGRVAVPPISGSPCGRPRSAGWVRCVA